MATCASPYCGLPATFYSPKPVRVVGTSVVGRFFCDACANRMALKTLAKQEWREIRRLRAKGICHKCGRDRWRGNGCLDCDKYEEDKR